MTEYVSATPGLYPLPDRAKDSLSDLKGHQKHDLVSGDEPPEVEEEYAGVREELVGDQTSRGVDSVVEGQARWDDMIAHPLTVHSNVEAGGIVRYYDNNNFYRDPRVQGPLTESGDVARELEAAGELLDDTSQQAVLPGPYSLRELATDEHYGDSAEFQTAVADFLAGEVDLFPDVDSLYLLEPSFVEDEPGDDEVEQAVDAVADVASAAGDTEVVVHTYWGAVPEDVYTGLLDADVDAVGFDLVEGAEGNRVNVREYGAPEAAAAGVVDGQNTLVEDPMEAAGEVEELEDAAGGFDRVYVSSNTELFYLPENKYKQKLDAVAETAEVLS